MQAYIVEVETTLRDITDDMIDQVMDALTAWHPSIGTGPTGALEATMTVPAEHLSQAVAGGLAAIVAAGLSPVTVTAMPESVRDAREGWAPIPDLLSVTEAADELGLTRQRILQLISNAELPATRVGRGYAIPRTALTSSSSWRSYGKRQPAPASR